MSSSETAIPVVKKNLSKLEYNLSNARRRRVTFVILVFPALAWFLSFMLWPLLNMFYLSTMRMEWIEFTQEFHFPG